MVCKWFALGSKNKHKVHSLRLHVHLVEYWASYLLVYVLSLLQMCTNLKTDPWHRRITCRRIKHNTLTFCSLNYKYLYVHFVRWRRRTGMQIIPAPTRMSEDCTARAGNINGVSILWGRTELRKRFCISFHLNEFTCSSFIQIVYLLHRADLFQVHNSALMQIHCKTNILRDTGECIIIIIISTSCRRRAPI